MNKNVQITARNDQVKTVVKTKVVTRKSFNQVSIPVNVTDSPLDPLQKQVSLPTVVHVPSAYAAETITIGPIKTQATP